MLKTYKMSAFSIAPLSLATAVTIRQKMDLKFTIWLMCMRLPMVVSSNETTNFTAYLLWQ